MLERKLADIVAEYKVTWQKNVLAVTERGEDPTKNGSVKESYAHYVAATRMLIGYLEEQPETQARMVRGAWDNSAAVARADELVADSHHWTSFVAEHAAVRG